MTDSENKITQLRLKGLGYKAIAVRLGISRDAVRTYCRRNGLTGEAEAAKRNYDEMKNNGLICVKCGVAIEQSQGRGRKRRFCSDRCRAEWWKKNSILHTPGEKTQTRQCPCCGKAFKSFASADRKYCSHKCYIEHRFGGNNNDRTN